MFLECCSLRLSFAACRHEVVYVRFCGVAGTHRPITTTQLPSTPMLYRTPLQNGPVWYTYEADRLELCSDAELRRQDIFPNGHDSTDFATHQPTELNMFIVVGDGFAFSQHG